LDGPSRCGLHGLFTGAADKDDRGCAGDDSKAKDQSMSKPRKALQARLAEIEVANSPFQCAWRGCQATPGDDPLPLPTGWHMLSVGDPPDLRNEVLCPTHARELNALLKPVADERLFGDAQGRG
jgi:hypothetical protein